MGLEFDPNSINANLKLWASYVPGRRPEFKTHKGSAAAKNSINVVWPHREGIIYESVDGKWIERDRSIQPTECAVCGGAISAISEDRKTFWRGTYPYGHSAHFLYDKSLPAYKQARECDDCYEKRYG